MPKKKEEPKTYKVTVDKKPGYCGEGAGGAQFAHGEALITKWPGCSMVQRTRRIYCH